MLLFFLFIILLQLCKFQEIEEDGVNLDHLFSVELYNESILNNLRKYDYNSVSHLHNQQFYDISNEANVKRKETARPISSRKADANVDNNTIHMATPQPMRDQSKLRGLTEELKMKKRFRDVEHYCDSNVRSIRDVTQGDDDSSLITRRFDRIKEQENFTLQKQYSKKPILREYYFNIRDEKAFRKRKQVMRNFMAHFVYATRYKLAYSQLLRHKYSQQARYQIGFNYALLRNLKREQRILYMTSYRYRFNFTNFYIHLKIYDKIMRLNVDIRDSLRLIYRLERARKIEISKSYYHDMTTRKIERSTTQKAAGKAKRPRRPAG